MVERNKILVVGPSKSGKFTLIKKLFNTLPDLPEGASHSGVIHDVELKTKYFSKDLQIWIDEFDNNDHKSRPQSSEEQTSTLYRFMKWSDEFKSSSMKEIRDVVAGIIFCIDYNNHDYQSEKDIEALVKELSCILKSLKKDQKSNADIANQLEKITINENENESFEDADLGEFFEPWDGFVLTVVFERKNALQNPKIDISVLKEVFLDNNLDISYYKEDEKLSSSDRDEFGDRLGIYKIQEIIETFDWNDIELKATKNEQILMNDEDVEQLTKPLNDDLSAKKQINDVNVNDILDRIRAAKENAANISNPQLKEKFANDFINDIIDLI